MRLFSGDYGMIAYFAGVTYTLVDIVCTYVYINIEEKNSLSLNTHVACGPPNSGGPVSISEGTRF